MSDYSNTVIYSVNAAVFTLLGSVVVLWNEERAKRFTVYLLSFAAGVMLGTTFFHLIPEACELVGLEILVYVLVGFLAFYIIENIIMFHPCGDERCEFHKLGTLSFIGLLSHSLLDGFSIAIGFEIEHHIGVLTALAVILHEFSEGISVSGILLHSQATKKEIYVKSTLVALATPVGAVSFGPVAKTVSTDTLAILLAFTAGSFLYIASADLIPYSHKRSSRILPVILLLGIGVVYLAGRFLHSH